jgi:hypothetical protein
MLLRAHPKARGSILVFFVAQGDRYFSLVFSGEESVVCI